MEWVTPKDYMRATNTGENRMYRYLANGTVRAFRTSKRGHWKIPVGELVAAEKRLYKDWQQ